MAYATKYRVFFADFDSAEYRADLMFDGYVGSVIEMDGAANCCSIQFGNADDKFQTINGSGMTLKFHNNGYDLSDLFAVGIYDIKVTIDRKWGTSSWFSIWSGYVNPEIYDEDYSWDRGEVSVTANDGLSAAGREKYFSGAQLKDDGTVLKPWSYGIVTNRAAIYRCLDKISIDRIYTIIDTTGSVSSFANLSVDLSNYVDEDGESMTKRDVLESILKPFGLRMYIFGYSCWIFDPCLLATNISTVSYLAYDEYFSPVVLENGSFTKDADLSAVSPVVSFVGGNQSMSTIGGFKTLISNYSAYPAVSKVIPTAVDDLPANINTLPWYHLDRVWNGVTEGWMHLFVFDDDASDHGFEFYGASGSCYYDFNSYTHDETITQKCIYGYNWLYNPSNPAATDPDDDIIVIKGGWLPKTGDTITIRFKMLMNCENRNVLKTRFIEFPFRLKVGNKYAICSQDSTIWQTPSYTNIWGADASEQISSSGEGFGEWMDYEIRVYGIETAGLFELHFGREIHAMDTNRADLWYQHFRDLFTLFVIKDFEVIVNGYEISDDDVEFKAESGIDFISKKTVELNNSSRRENGCLDRGSFINANGEHETYFNRISYPYSGSMGLTLAQGFLNNYKSPFRTLSATLKGNQLLRNTSSITSAVDRHPKTISNLLCPMMVIQDTTYLGTKRFMFIGGTFNLIDKMLSGVWHEVFDANYLITEV